MSMVTFRSVSARKAAASRRNSLKSTGPRTPEGKRHSSLNALKHGLRSSAINDALRELGEDPVAFYRLRQDLTSAVQPADPIEALLVEDLTALWWKKARAERAQAALLWRELEKLEQDRLRKLLEANRRSLVEAQADYTEGGLRRAKSWVRRSEDVLTPLRFLLALVDGRQWSEKSEEACDMLYGKQPTWRGAQIRDTFRKLRESKPSDAGSEGEARAAGREEQEAVTRGLAAELRQLILEEMRDVIEEAGLFYREHYEVSSAMRRACLAPTDWRWTLILRQEAFLDRQLDRKLKLLLQFKKFRGQERWRRKRRMRPRQRKKRMLVERTKLPSD
jgi:hypothetical protein